ncbi:TspO/MBR family protein [Roseomonas sp. CCTCC AB2023176]|uniref:TspO/MBR family protein n=1 Tax=Roseomonas sp. CCTCC AB2023176 TaxID=3342640 RepID=UPI0035D91321
MLDRRGQMADGVAVRRGKDWRPIWAAAGWAVVVAMGGGLLTEIGPWYRGLIKPSWQPPDWLFGPAWTLIFALSASAGIRAWEASRDLADRRAVVIAFVANGVLNVLWSLLFFKLHRPDWALIEVVPLWLSIAALAWICWRRSRLAGWLLVPYLAWVGFAAYLNLTIVRLNGPFG